MLENEKSCFLNLMKFSRVISLLTEPAPPRSRRDPEYFRVSPTTDLIKPRWQAFAVSRDAVQ